VITVAGDVLPEATWEKVPDASCVFDGVHGEFERADLVFLNLEEPITASNQVTRYKDPRALRAQRDFVLRARDSTVPVSFKKAGVGLVGLANNHMMDYETAGLRDTLRAFRRAGLPVVGAGLEPEAESAWIFEKGGLRVALVDFSDVVPPHSEATNTRIGIASSKDPSDLIRAIQRAHRQADFVILMMHWGGQGKHLITARQRRLARSAVNAGCGVIVGMHPHVLQGIEYVDRAPVFYSIGNFVFPSSSPAARECMMVNLTIGRDGLKSVDLVPVEISPRGCPKVAREQRAHEILAHLDNFCRMFNTQILGHGLAHSELRSALVYDRSDEVGEERFLGEKSDSRP